MRRAGLRRRGAGPTLVDRALEGADAPGNVVLPARGTARQFGFKPRDHADLGTQLRILDLERGAKVSGSRFYYLRGAGVLLEQALMRFALDLVLEAGVTPVPTPVPVPPGGLG